ncbi:Serine/threonine protein kinase [Actinopolymorpha cephalotaxi]|uniref:non-specific serine/threonine protein kinase n=1 Tax=Actinopolymorpha cephalotaxi TaxID=504797 RepID=A0A1I3BB84_9ACTN|nr:gas vesicle protein GvpJ [Actinopolymorpha cephalotaxi]NYH86781.1 serine/threonine protein kinase [Actinopolymorpha cephalotaxi]SFH59575.1 Serine/threonine protein kinase [Actinopolymorpha cephalotaxi]
MAAVYAQNISRAPRPHRLAEVVEAVLHKGIVIEANLRVAVVGAELLALETRAVIASIDTYIRFAEVVSRLDWGRQEDVAGMPVGAMRGATPLAAADRTVLVSKDGDAGDADAGEERKPVDRPLDGRYELRGLLGHGGMAEVWDAADNLLGRSVAVKILRSHLAVQPEFLARFRREARLAAALSHPSIVAVHDTGTTHHGGVDVPFIVMEQIEGTTLKEVAAESGPLRPGRSLEILIDVLDALQASHRHGIVHRDVKPGNIMVTTSGAIKVMDFGIACSPTEQTGRLTDPAAIVGTAQYLSPEQAAGRPIDNRSDIYAVGCVLYELLTGVPPFTGPTPYEVACRHMHEEPLAPSVLLPGLPPEYDAIVLRALQKDPDRRYQSAASMRRAISRALTSSIGGRAEHVPG